MTVLIVHWAVLVSAFAGFFFLTLFCLFPVGLGAVDAETGAPVSPRVGTKVLIALAVAVALFAVFCAVIRAGIVQL